MSQNGWAATAPHCPVKAARNRASRLAHSALPSLVPGFDFGCFFQQLFAGTTQRGEQLPLTGFMRHGAADDDGTDILCNQRPGSVTRTGEFLDVCVDVQQSILKRLSNRVVGAGDLRCEGGQWTSVFRTLNVLQAEVSACV